MRFSLSATVSAAVLSVQAAGQSTITLPTTVSTFTTITRSANSSSTASLNFTSTASRSAPVTVTAILSKAPPHLFPPILLPTVVVPPVEVPALTPLLEVPVVVAPPKTSAKPPPPAPTPTASPPPPPPVTPPGSGLAADQQKALDLHNSARRDVGCAPLSWDAGLAKDAQGWANYLATTSALEHAKGISQGENLYYQTAGSTGPAFSAATQWWLDEKDNYNYQPVPQSSPKGDFAAYGHYTQCVWSATTKVGMAIATDSKGTTWVVARYLTAGNGQGQRPY